MARNTSVEPGWGEDTTSDLFAVEDAKKAGAPLLIELFGPSESGKTLSALLIARGLAGDDGDVALMDTEGGRGRLFADKIPGGYKYGWLRPPFTVENYERGIELFLRDCPKLRALVIDSASHCWSAQGGVLDQVDRAEANNVPMRMRWTKPKRRYNRFIDYLTTSRIHIILCSRGRQPIEEKRVDGKAQMVPLPWQPIRSPSMRYELTICLPMVKDGYYDLANPQWKCAGDLRRLFPGGDDRPSVEHGRLMAQWVAGGDPVDTSLELLIKRAFDRAELGTEKMRAFWETVLTREDRARLKGHVAALQSAARSADEAIEQERLANGDDERNGDSLDSLANPFGNVTKIDDAAAESARPSETPGSGDIHTSARKEVITQVGGAETLLARVTDAADFGKPADQLRTAGGVRSSSSITSPADHVPLVEVYKLSGRAPDWARTKADLIAAFLDLTTLAGCTEFRKRNAATVQTLRQGSFSEYEAFEDVSGSHERGLHEQQRGAS